MSKGLEALHHPRIKLAKVDISAEGKHDIAYMFFDDTKQYVAIEKELKDKEKKDKALETITRELNVEIEEDKGAYFICITGWYFEIPKEEYDLLKEVLYELPTKQV